MRRKTDSKERRAFLLHKQGAENQRGIAFHFTYEGWVGWWETNLGPDWFSKRGHHRDEYVMARYGDTGPYAIWNVKCITQSENAREQASSYLAPENHPALRVNRAWLKLTKEQVTVIYLELKNNPAAVQRVLAAEFNVSGRTIRDIKTKKTWRLVTDLLD